MNWLPKPLKLYNYTIIQSYSLLNIRTDENESENNINQIISDLLVLDTEC